MKKLIGSSPYLPTVEEEEEFIDRFSAEEFDRQSAYAAYLESPEWELIRERVLARDGNRCCHCLSPRNLQIHHIRYISRWRESGGEIGHLITLCGGCHKRAHHG